ncbi:MAG: hypothetical protein JXR26_02380 [Balneolaceae bacterium]|nr:hypothetical protein [Balneolaceae bacterium]
MKKIFITIIVLFLAGCGGGLSSSWNNFTAYYNTFYNAKNDYRSGLKKVKQQPVQLNPDVPIRPHPAPVNAGSDDFEEAINKGALILRRHSDSKWTDDALLLIGKSYYYRQEFFLAIQSFEELVEASTPNRLRQEAILWKGRALLDIASYGEGISFLETQLADSAHSWSPDLESEVKVMLAQHHAMLENWQQSASILEPAILRVEDRALKGRSYFLLGQVLQFQGDLTRAYQAYSNVEPNFPDYEYIYWANIKRAEVSRLNGNFDLAISIYRSMLSDDKNFDHQNALSFELAQTYEQEGEVRKAEMIYKNILSSPRSEQLSLLADTYYQLGQLYSREYNDYRLAAAYYDSSSSLSRQIQNASDQSATQLATAYGDYISLKNRIAKVDSLIALGQLNPQELDSALVAVRRQKRALLRDKQSDDQQEENILTNVVQDTSSDPVGGEPESSRFGFLNYRNARMVEAARQQFRARWGNRPLVDNWRRTNAILSTSDETQSTVPEGSETPQNGLTDRQLGIDLREIPQTLQQKKEKRKERLNLQYRLGNLFFLTLNQPDSAQYYFRKVLDDTTDSSLEPQTLYSMFKLYELREKPDSAAKYRQRILDKYAGSVYARRIEGGQLNSDALENTADTTEKLRDKVQKLLSRQEHTPPNAERAEHLRNLALENRDSPLAPSIYYQAIREYIRVAKAADSSVADTSNYQGIPDSLNIDTLRYSRTEWNQVRALLDEFKEVFPAAPQIQTVDQWSQVINQTGTNGLLTCKELNITPKVTPDMPTFLQAIKLPERLKGLSLSGSLTYRLEINTDGTVNSFELISNPTNLGIEEAYEKAMKAQLRFEPIDLNGKGKTETVSCEVDFPIKQ